MSSFPASAEPAAKAGIGPEGHKRTASVESGADTDATLVGDSKDELGADLKSARIDEAVPTPAPAPRAPKRAASVTDLAAQAAKRGRVGAEMASGAPEGDSVSNDATGSSTAAAPITISTYTAAAPAAADTNTLEAAKPQEASTTTTTENSTHRDSTSAPANASTRPMRGRKGRAGLPTVLFDVTSPAPTHPRVSEAAIAAQMDCWSVRPPSPPPPTLTTSMTGALRSIVGSPPSPEPVNWEAIAAQSSSTPGPPPKSGMEKAIRCLSTLVDRGTPDEDPVAESKMQGELNKIQGKIGTMIATVGTSSGTRQPRPPSKEKTQHEIDAEADEAERDELEVFKNSAYEPALGWPDMDDPAFDVVPEWM